MSTSNNAAGDFPGMNGAAGHQQLIISSDNVVDVHTKPVTLLTMDGQRIVIKASIACMALTIRRMMEDDCANDAIPVPIHSEFFPKLLEYCHKHVENESKENLKVWDLEYIDVDQAILLDIILAANFLEIKDLLHLGCEEVARRIRGKTVEEIRMILNIKNDFTTEEEATIRKENQWAFE